jgi:hypothetical protein
VNAYLFGVICQQLYSYWINREYHHWLQVVPIGKLWQVSMTLYMSSERTSLCLMHNLDSHSHRIFVVAQFMIIVVQGAMYASAIDSPNR